MSADQREDHARRVAESWRVHRICCAIAPQLGRTEDEMVSLGMLARHGPRDEAEFRAWQTKAIEMSMRSIWRDFDKPVGAYAYKDRGRFEAEVAAAFDMIRRTAAKLPVVRDSKAAAELAFIRYAIEGPDNKPLQTFIKQVTRWPRKRAK
jgi:hypothetical protein